VKNSSASPDPQKSSRIGRDDLAEMLAKDPALADLKLSLQDCRRILDGLTAQIREKVQAGSQVQIFGFGSWTGTPVPAKRVRNARAGKWVEVGPRVRFGWKPGTDWKLQKPE